MQNDPADYSEQRCLYYWSRIYNDNFKKGKNYKKLKKVICIWFLNKDKYKDLNNFESKWRLKCDEAPDTNYFDFIEFHIIELQKFRNDDTIKPSKKNFWLWFLDHTNEEMIKLAYISYEKIKEAREQIEKITADPELRHEMLRADLAEADEIARKERAAEKERIAIEEAERVGTEKGEKIGIEKGEKIGIEKGEKIGIEKGEKNEKNKIAKKMLEDKVPIETIEMYTGLTKEEIERLNV